MARTERASKGQRKRIENMLKSGLIDRIEAQGIIEKHREAAESVKRRQPSSKPVVAERLAFWEERFPGKGEALMAILQPFYCWQPKLKPALPDLEERVKLAIFWREIAGVRVFHVSDADSLRAVLLFRDTLGDSLRASFLPWRVNPLLTALAGSLRESVWSSIEEGALWTSIEEELWTSIEDSLLDSLGNSLRALLRVLPWRALWAALFISCGFVVVGRHEEVTKIKPLLKLWLEGNYPIRFDEEGNLLVLVAKPSSPGQAVG